MLFRSDWLRTMEKKLEIARVDEQDKVPFVTHYLEGPADVWWDNQKDMRGNGTTITWTEFQEIFRTAYIPSSLMKMKQHELLALTQGSSTVSEYLTKFNDLSRYAPEDVNTDEKKRTNSSTECIRQSRLSLAFCSLQISKPWLTPHWFRRRNTAPSMTPTRRG